MIHGIDVSEFQENIDWGKVAASDVGFVLIRATYGRTGLDKYFVYNRDEARAHHIPIGFYHFAEGYDPTAEALNFLGTVGSLLPGETLCLDDETSQPEHNWWASTFINVLRPHVAVPILYSNYSGFRAIGVVPKVCAWIAYPGTPPLNAPAGYGGATLLNQYGVRSVPGIVDQTDANVLLSDDLDTFRKLGANYQPAPPPIHVLRSKGVTMQRVLFTFVPKAGEKQPQLVYVSDAGKVIRRWNAAFPDVNEEASGCQPHADLAYVAPADAPDGNHHILCAASAVAGVPDKWDATFHMWIADGEASFHKELIAP